MRITVPFPPKELNPNCTIHWSKKFKIIKQYRLTCFVECRNAGYDAIPWEGDIHVFISFYPPDKRHRDDDNVIAAFKAGRDGLADALRVNDKRFIVHPMLMTEPLGKVVVTFTQRG